MANKKGNNRKHDGIRFIGEKFGRLTILSKGDNDNSNNVRYLCQCECGNKKLIPYQSLKSGTTKSCGCLRNEKVKEAGAERSKKYLVDWDAPERRCCTCKIVKKVEEFGKCSGGRRCKQCDRDRANEYRASGKSRINEIERKFGINYEFYLRMIEEQGNKCGICRKPLEKGVNGLAIDHCHKSEKVRGVLCRDCNLGLGFFKDNIISLLKAVDYLKENYSDKY